MEDKFAFGIEESFDNLYKKGAFFTAGDEKEANTMRISWGSIGFMWKKPVFIAMIRESRYTSKFLELGKSFTISIPYGEDMNHALEICGSKSGRDINKEKEANIKFVKSNSVDAPIVDKCQKYYECKIVLKQAIDLDSFNKDMRETYYPENETNHHFIFGEIIKVY